MKDILWLLIKNNQLVSYANNADFDTEFTYTVHTKKKKNPNAVGG